MNSLKHPSMELPIWRETNSAQGPLTSDQIDARVNDAAAALPNTPEGFSPSAGEIAAAHEQVAASALARGRNPAATPSWATERTGERPAVTAARENESTPTDSGVDPWSNAQPAEPLSVEDLTIGRGERPPYSPDATSSSSDNPWAAGHGEYPIIQRPTQGPQHQGVGKHRSPRGYTGRRRR